MAGPYVHCLVTREALRKLYANVSLASYQSITNPDESAKYFSYVCLGSVSPDFPYPALAIGYNSGTDRNKWTWGDKFHKQNTGNFINIGIQKLRPSADWASDSYLKKAAWLMGYYSHVITDVVIHAVVYELVGGCYENHKHDHLYCEVVQDSLLFHDVYSYPAQELIDVRMIKDILEDCRVESSPSDADQQSLTVLPTYVLDNEIENFWDFILSQNYSDFYRSESPRFEDWFYEYNMVMTLGTKPVARTLAPGMAYHRSTDILPSDKTKYYTDITLPDGTRGDYKNSVFNKAVNEVAKRLETFLKAFDNSESFTELINDLKPWNMDKGTINDQSPQFALWNGQTEFPFQCPGDPPLTS